MSILDDEGVRRSILEAWLDSKAGTPDACEQGGFVLRNADGKLVVERWPHGLQSEITVPQHQDGRRGGSAIVATFHTHPNSGADFQQEPSLTDIRAVRDDPNLSHPEYEGEYVIATQYVYRIQRNGEYDVIGPTSKILGTG